MFGATQKATRAPPGHSIFGRRVVGQVVVEAGIALHCGGGVVRAQERQHFGDLEGTSEYFSAMS